jgi:GTP-binding protein Era
MESLDIENYNMTKTRCNFVTIIGAPNAGKSTLTNLFVGTKVTIVSPKVQTTRSSVKGIIVEDNTQLIFCDTPGIFKSTKRKLERAIVANAFEQLQGDMEIIYMLDIRKIDDEDNKLIIDYLRKTERKVIVAINKIDLIKHKDKLLPIMTRLGDLDIAKQLFLLSAEKNDGVADLKKYLLENAPESPYFYPEDQLTDASERFLAQEITREKLFLALDEEIPYNLSVETESWKDLDSGAAKLDQVIYITRASQKKIVIGNKGELIKRVGIQARREMEKLFGRRIHLYLHVKQKEDWLNQNHMYEHMGLKK